MIKNRSVVEFMRFFSHTANTVKVSFKQTVDNAVKIKNSSPYYSSSSFFSKNERSLFNAAHEMSEHSHAISSTQKDCIDALKHQDEIRKHSAY